MQSVLNRQSASGLEMAAQVYDPLSGRGSLDDRTRHAVLTTGNFLDAGR